MKTENRKWNPAKGFAGKIPLVILALFAVLMLGGCKSGDDGDSSPFVKQYGYKLNYDTNYHRVAEFTCLLGENNTYIVQSVILHYFLITDYPNVTGADLVTIAKNRSVAPSSKSQGQSSGKDQTVNSADGKTFKVSANIIPEIWTYKKKTVTRYGYKLNSDESYHRVVVYVAADNGDHTFEVKSYNIHYFAISNSNYTNRTGSELCDMVRTGAVTPSSSKNYILPADSNPTMTNASAPNGKDTFHIHKGQQYTVYYYF